MTLGILVGDLLVLGLGPGAAQLALVLAVVMVLAVLLGSAPLFVQQSAVSAALVVTIQPPSEGFDFARSIDALVGSGCALAVHLLLLPVNPLVDVRRAAEPLVAELAATLRDVAAALRAQDARAAERALLRARAIQPYEAAFTEAVTAGRETARLAPPRRRAREPLDTYAEALAQIDLAQRNARVLARAALRAVQIGEHIPPGVPEAVEELAAGAGAVTDALAERARFDTVREPAARAAAIATVALEQTGNLSVASMVSQVRSTAVDLLRSTGCTREDAIDLVRRAADEALQATHEET